jgi:hypothetical protein
MRRRSEGVKGADQRTPLTMFFNGDNESLGELADEMAKAMARARSAEHSALAGKEPGDATENTRHYGVRSQLRH